MYPRNIVDPRVIVLNIQHAPREGSSEHYVQPATGREHRAIYRPFRRPITSRREMSDRPVTIIPFFLQFFMQCGVVNFVGHFPSAKLQLRVGREAVSGQGRPAETPGIGKRIRAHIEGWLVHDQAAIYLCNYLESRAKASLTGSTTTNTATTPEKRLVVGECRQFNGRFLGINMYEIYPRGFIRIFLKLERLFASAVFKILYPFFAHFVVFTKQPDSRVPRPGNFERHHVCERATRVQEAARQDNNRTIRSAILESHDHIAIGGIFSKHSDKAKRRCIHQGDKSW